MVELSSLVVSSLTGVFGVVIGAVISNYLNQKIARQSTRKDLIFKKKIEYFEKILECISKNTELYKNSIKRIEKGYEKKDILDILNHLRSNRKKFEIMNSPLYLDISKISFKIRQFVTREKIIFLYFEKLQDEVLTKEEAVKNLNIDLLEIRRIGGDIVHILRKHLKED